uniref:Secreted protein n=1 Tax=Strongyloides venezuelensis TaxID=75913 RepID=A0A0K0G5Y0_STRVS
MCIFSALFHMCKNSEFNKICRFFDFVCKIPALNFLCAASLAQSAARQSHNLKVVSSSLTRGILFTEF